MRVTALAREGETSKQTSSDTIGWLGGEMERRRSRAGACDARAFQVRLSLLLGSEEECRA